MNNFANREVLYKYLGEVSYGNGLEIQEALQKRIIKGEMEGAGIILFLSHNPVITNGKHGNDENLLINADLLKDAGVEYYRTTRGGDATYHGPGQLVCYPILNLKVLRLGIRRYINSLEKIIIEFLSDIGIDGRAVDGLHGVWVGNEKIASIGVRVKRHVTMHGFALNISNDLSAFEFINPCGLEGVSITSVKQLLGREYDLDGCIDPVMDHFRSVFNFVDVKELDMNPADIFET